MAIEPTTAVVNAPSRRVFAPFFKARWQNMQNIVNDSVFYSMVPAPYLNYYQAYIRQWTDWARGFVPMLHRQDFFSTGIGYTVCDIFAGLCMQGGFRFNSINEDLEKAVTRWGDKYLTDVFSRMFFHANAGGNALLVLTPIYNDLLPSVVPINRAFFEIGRSGDISAAVIFNRFVSGETAYYAKEIRVMCEGRPYYMVQLAEGTLVTCPTFTGSAMKDVPEIISAQWAYNYGDIKPNEWYEMPPKMQGIGVYNVQNKSVAASISDMPGYSDSSLHTALDVLYSIDYNYTQGQLDQYFGKSRGLIPKQFSRANISLQRSEVVNGGSFIEELNAKTPELNDEFYTQVSSGDINGTPIKPTIMQSDLRGEERKYIRDSDLELLAAKVKLSASTLANHLNYNTSKTATEVRSETDTTEMTVAEKRRLAGMGINKMLADYARFLGYYEEITIEWGRAGVNTSTENAELMADYQAGVLPLRMYLRKRWAEMSEAEIEKMAQEIEKTKQAEQAQFRAEERLRFEDFVE